MKAKSIFVGIAVAAIFLLFLSFTAVSKVLSANPSALLQGVKTQPQAVNFLPKRSPLFFSFLVNPDRLGMFAKLAAKPSDRAAIDRQFLSLKQQLQQHWSLDYDHDVQPWLGDEVTLAVTTTDIDRLAENGLQPGYLFAVAVKDRELAKQSVEQFWQRLAIAGSDLGFEQYQGIPIVFADRTERNAAIASATIGKFVLFANDLKVIRNAIADLQVPNLALAGLDAYQNNVKQLTQTKLGLAFINLTELGEWGAASGFLPPSLKDFPIANLSLGFGLDRQGITAETVLTFDPPATKASNLAANNSIAKPKQQSSNGSNQILQTIPAGSALLVSHDLGGRVRQISDALKPYPNLDRSFKQAIATIAESTNLSAVMSSLDLLDLLKGDWLTGDYAIAAIPNAAGKSDWVFAIENTDLKVKAAIERLDASARIAKLTVGDLRIDRQNVTIWTQLSTNTSARDSENGVNGNVAIAHTQIDPNAKYVMFSNSIAALESVLASGGTHPLRNRQPIAESANFKKIISKLPQNQTGFLYGDRKVNLNDLAAKFPLFTSTLNRMQNSPFEVLLDRIQAVNLVGNYRRNTDFSQYGEIFILLK